MSDNKRQVLNTAIEREIHKLLKDISEGVYDRLQLYCRKTQVPVEPEVLTHILKTVQVVIGELEFAKVDGFHAAIKKPLDDYAGTNNPPTDLERLAETVQRPGAAVKKNSKQD